MSDILPINITISWVRHAESISNVLEGNYPDKKSDNFDKEVFNTYIDTLKDNEMEDYREYLPKIQDELNTLTTVSGEIMQKYIKPDEGNSQNSNVNFQDFQNQFNQTINPEEFKKQ